MELFKFNLLSHTPVHVQILNAMAPEQLASDDATGAHMMLTSAFTVSKAQLDLPSQASFL